MRIIYIYLEYLRLIYKLLIFFLVVAGSFVSLPSTELH